MIPIRTPGPMAPKRISFKFYLAMALIAWAGGMLPEVGHSTPAVARGVYSDLGTPVTQIIALRAPDWARTPDAYQPLPMREERLNALFNSAVDALTHGEAIDSRDRLLGLEASLHDTVNALGTARQMMATTPANPCAMADTLGQLTCHFSTSKSDLATQISELHSTVQQRQQQILTERDRFSADLQKIGLSISPAQVDGLLQMVTARDIVSLHAVYANLRSINGQLQQAAQAASATPAAIRRYYAIYTVLLEVAMHMHEEIYYKLQNTYLPRLDSLAAATANTLRQARALSASTSRAELSSQLQSNMTSLTATLRAAMLYRQSLQAQAGAVNASWKQLFEQHQVAVNSLRAASLSADLLAQMKASGNHLATLRQLDIPAIEGISNAAVQREFERLTREIQLPNT